MGRIDIIICPKKKTKAKTKRISKEYQKKYYKTKKSHYNNK